jgi:hypothetical protein
MANTTISLIDLDFNGLKESLKSHMRSQDRFKDYDFEGSNISTLLDVLSYNTYLNVFYLNMVASEMFLDSAQTKDSIVSHAKELNYLPRSFRSSTAVVDIAITPSTSVTSVVVPKGTGFTSRIGSNTFNFVTGEALALTSSTNGVFYANNTTIYEGAYVTDSFVKSDTTSEQRFILSNPNIDTTSIQVSILENSGANQYTYVQAFSLFGHNSNSNIFFVQPAENELYEIVFGDDIIGRRPKSGAIIDVDYRISTGELSNGADNFVNNSNIDGHSNVRVTMVSSAVNGSVSESVDSIKFNATRNFQAQERAVTEEDYRTLLLREFPEIQAISVYGGEKVDPPQYGKVFIAVDISNADGIPELNKTLYNSYLSDKIPLSVTTEFVTPNMIYLKIVSTVKYNVNITTLSENDIKSKVLSSIVDYSSSVLNDFNSEFSYSNFLSKIDLSDKSILSNYTQINPFIRIVPTVNTNNSYVLNFNNPILITSPGDAVHAIDTDKGLFSSAFTYGGATCVIEDDGLGKLRIVKISSTEHTEVKKIGTVDYQTGTVNIVNFDPSSFTGAGIDIFIKPVSLDFATSKNDILTIDIRDVSVNMVPVRK